MSFEARLEALSTQLLKKQLLLDDAACSKAALSARLRAATQALQRAEAQALAAAQQATHTHPVSLSLSCSFTKARL